MLVPVKNVTLRYETCGNCGDDEHFVQNLSVIIDQRTAVCDACGESLQLQEFVRIKED